MDSGHFFIFLINQFIFVSSLQLSITGPFLKRYWTVLQFHNKLLQNGPLRWKRSSYSKPPADS